MKRIVLVLVAVIGVWACAQSSEEAQTATDTLTRRQKDSLLGSIPMPGASGIGDAQRATDLANARAAQHDTAN